MPSNNIYQSHRPGNTDELFLKLSDGDAIKMRIFSQPAIVVYKEGDRPRYAWVVINHNNKKAQVYGAGVSVYSQIADLVEEWGPPTEFDILVRRKGSGQFDTEYSVTPTKDPIAPTKEQEVEAEKVDLLNACKGKWLVDYEADGELPAPVLAGAPTKPDKAVEVPDGDIEIEDLDDDKVDPADIPF